MSGLDDNPRYKQDYHFIELAFEQAEKSYSEGGIPIGALLVSSTGTILGKGHNMRIQKGSSIHHAEMSAFENAGRLTAKELLGATMYTTLSPCVMCSGACLLYNITRVVMAENDSFLGAEDMLRAKGVEVINMNHSHSRNLMRLWIEENKTLWEEDIST